MQKRNEAAQKTKKHFSSLRSRFEETANFGILSYESDAPDRTGHRFQMNFYLRLIKMSFRIPDFFRRNMHIINIFFSKKVASRRH